MRGGARGKRKKGKRTEKKSITNEGGAVPVPGFLGERQPRRENKLAPEGRDKLRVG